MSDGHVVVLAGWKVGLRTIRLMVLIRQSTSLNLREAKTAMERVVDGEQVALTFATEEDARRFLARRALAHVPRMTKP